MSCSASGANINSNGTTAPDTLLHSLPRQTGDWRRLPPSFSRLQLLSLPVVKWHRVWSSPDIVPKILDQLKLLCQTQIKNRLNILRHLVIFDNVKALPVPSAIMARWGNALTVRFGSMSRRRRSGDRITAISGPRRHSKLPYRLQKGNQTASGRPQSSERGRLRSRVRRLLGRDSAMQPLRCQLPFRRLGTEVLVRRAEVLYLLGAHRMSRLPSKASPLPENQSQGRRTAAKYRSHRLARSERTWTSLPSAGKQAKRPGDLSPCQESLL